MRSLAIVGCAGALLALPAVADSAPYRSAMTVANGGGGAPMPMPMQPPAGGGWSSGGWHGGTPGGGWHGGGYPGGGYPGGGHPGYPGGGTYPGHGGSYPGHGGNYPGHGGMYPGGGWHGGGYPGGGYGHGWGNWAGGGAYHRPYRGRRLSNFYIAPSFFISDWNGYGLSAPGYGQGWYRYYDDAVLAGGDGMIYDTRDGIDWDDYDSGPVPDYAGAEPAPPPPPPSRQGWRDDGVTWGTTPMVYQSPPGTTTTVVIQSAPVVTTHTYVEERVVYAQKRVRVWKPKVRWHAPACSCGCVCR